MQHTRKRKRGKYEASHVVANMKTMQSQQDEPLTQSKVTNRRLELDCRIAFLQQVFRLKTAAPWPPARRSKRESYAIIVRRRMLTLDEQRRVIWLRFGS